METVLHNSGPAQRRPASYRQRLSRSELAARAERLRSLLDPCTLCPRRCGARRLNGEHGVYRLTDQVLVSSASAHFGEEPPLVGRRGSGTIFFSSCNLKCLFCQNYEISHLRRGQPVSAEQLASIMPALQEAGCHNINLVTPTHVTPQIIEALVIAADRGLTLPLVYNCGGYESVETLSILDGIVDIYMPDIKYSRNDNARRYSGARDYWDVVRPAVKEMHRQVGILKVDEHGLAVRGVLIRHLVLPDRLAGTKEVLEFIAREVSADSYVNLMDQYRPAFRAAIHRELNRPISVDECDEAIAYAAQLGLRRGPSRIRVFRGSCSSCSSTRSLHFPKTRSHLAVLLAMLCRHGDLWGQTNTATISSGGSLTVGPGGLKLQSGLSNAFVCSLAT